MGKINWDGMLGNYIKLESGTAKTLRVSNWRAQEMFKDDAGNLKPGIIFDVLIEDGVEKENCTWTVTSIRAMVKLRPILEKAEADGHTEVDLNVLKVGEGKKTQYEIKAM